MSGDGKAKSEIPVDDAVVDGKAAESGTATHAQPSQERGGTRDPSHWRALDQHFEEAEAPGFETLELMMIEAGTDVVKLALRLDLGADVLAAVVRGEVPGLPRPRLLRALAYELGAPYDAVAQATMSAAAAVFIDAGRGLSDGRRAPIGLTAPAGAHATGASIVRPRSDTFRDLVERSSMTSEQKAYWLGDD